MRVTIEMPTGLKIDVIASNAEEFSSACSDAERLIAKLEIISCQVSGKTGPENSPPALQERLRLAAKRE